MSAPEAPRVSWIAVTRNRARFIPAALEQWLSLKRPGEELVVVDGASTDGTIDLLRAAGPAVDTLIHEPDRGEAHALNKGLLAARGRYIKFLSDDDVCYREPLDQAFDAMDRDPSIDLLVTGGEAVDCLEDPSNRTPSHYQWYPDGARLNRDHAFVGMGGLGLVVRRSSLSLIGLFDTRHRHADTSFLTQATVRGAKMRYLRVKGFSHRVGRQSISAVSVRKTYIYRDFGFRGLSRWRYLTRPRLLLEVLAHRFDRRGGRVPPEPVWDGRLME